MKCTTSLVMFLIVSVGCGGGNGTPSATGGVVSGTYEFVVASNVTGSTTLIEANLSASGDNSNASGPSQVQILGKLNGVWYLNGICPGTTPGQNAVSTSLNNNNVTLMFNEGGATFSGQGMLTGNSVSASYTITNSTCPALSNQNTGEPPGYDQGGITGNPVPALAGTFSGVLNLPNGADNAALTLTEGANNSLTVQAKLAGLIDDGTFTFSGSAVGNVVFVSGSISGKPLSLFGYYDHDGSITGTANSLLIFNYNTLTNAGLLLGQ